jgi:stearoyl-CoA desaturase (delta-9 desaturase)
MNWFLQALLLGTLVGLGVSIVANTCTTVFLHRALSHRALTLRQPATFVFRLFVWITTGIRPRQWVAVHRKHHAYTDIEGDPHSPVLLGWVTVQMKNVALYRAAAKDEELLNKYAKDLPYDAWDRALFNRAFLGLGVGIVLLIVVFGPIAGLIAAVVHMNFYLAGSAAVNAIGHRFGRRTYPNGATNLQWLALLTMGEGLHNNHHAAPSSPRLSHRRSEFDPGWWVVRILAWSRLAHLRFTDVRLTARAKSMQSTSEAA